MTWAVGEAGDDFVAEVLPHPDSMKIIARTKGSKRTRCKEDLPNVAASYGRFHLLTNRALGFDGWQLDEGPE